MSETRKAPRLETINAETSGEHASLELSAMKAEQTVDFLQANPESMKSFEALMQNLNSATQTDATTFSIGDVGTLKTGAFLNELSASILKMLGWGAAIFIVAVLAISAAVASGVIALPH